MFTVGQKPKEKTVVTKSRVGTPNGTVSQIHYERRRTDRDAALVQCFRPRRSVVHSKGVALSKLSFSDPTSSFLTGATLKQLVKEGYT